jgi:hypothetical protein
MALPAIAAAAAPCHPWPVSPEVTDPNELAADCNSAASPSQAVAAASIGADPGPEYIRSELISGGNIEKFIFNIPSSDMSHNDDRIAAAMAAEDGELRLRLCARDC